MPGHPVLVYPKEYPRWMLRGLVELGIVAARPAEFPPVPNYLDVRDEFVFDHIRQIFAVRRVTDDDPRMSSVTARGWKAYRSDDPEMDEPPKLAFYCPDCSRHEFGV